MTHTSSTPWPCDSCFVLYRRSSVCLERRAFGRSALWRAKPSFIHCMQIAIAKSKVHVSTRCARLMKTLQGIPFIVCRTLYLHERFQRHDRHVRVVCDETTRLPLDNKTRSWCLITNGICCTLSNEQINHLLTLHETTANTRTLSRLIKHHATDHIP